MEKHHFPIPSVIIGIGKGQSGCQNHSLGKRLRTGCSHDLRFLTLGLLTEHRGRGCLFGEDSGRLPLNEPSNSVPCSETQGSGASGDAWGRA